MTTGAKKHTLKILLPTPGRLTKSTLIIFDFGAYWGATGGSYIYKEQIKLLPTALGMITGSGASRAGAGCAVGVMMLVPPLILFLFSQSAIMETMSTAGLK